MALEPLPVLRLEDVPAGPETQAWLVEELWGDQAVGVIGGNPKACKTWLALDLAVSVASNTPALGRFPVQSPGPALIYAAEDSLSAVRNRVLNIAAARGLPPGNMDLALIQIPTLRVDSQRDFQRLSLTIGKYRPRLLVLDPLVRIHQADENSAAEISALLGNLRQLQRQFAVAIVLVHHLRKNGSPNQPGQALRGSGDLHAWGDSNLYLHRKGDNLRLTVEHRNAPSPQPMQLELARKPVAHLRIIEQEGERVEPVLEHKLLELLRAASGPVDRETIRQSLHIRNHTLGLVLVQLRHNGHIERSNGGFRLAETEGKYHRSTYQKPSPAATTAAATSASPPKEDRATVATDPSASGDSRGMGGRANRPAAPLFPHLNP